MKNIINITLSIITIGLFFSCGDDSYSIAYVDNEVKVDLVGTLALNVSGAAPGTTMMTVTVTIPQTFDVESTVEVTAESAYGPLLAVETFITKTYIKIPAGSTSGTGSILMPGEAVAIDAFTGLPNYGKAFISGLALTQPEDGKIDDPYVMTSEEVSLTALDFHDPYMAPNDGTLMMSLDWEGPYDINDFDLFVKNSAGVNVENSETGTRFEGDFFNNPANENRADGEYIVYIFVYDIIDGNVPWRLVFTYEDGSTDVYEGTLDPTSFGKNINVVVITKSTDADGNRAYSTASY